MTRTEGLLGLPASSGPSDTPKCWWDIDFKTEVSEYRNSNMRIWAEMAFFAVRRNTHEEQRTIVDPAGAIWKPCRLLQLNLETLQSSR